MLIIVTEGQGDRIFQTSCQSFNTFCPILYLGSRSCNSLCSECTCSHVRYSIDRALYTGKCMVCTWTIYSFYMSTFPSYRYGFLVFYFQKILINFYTPKCIFIICMIFCCAVISTPPVHAQLEKNGIEKMDICTPELTTKDEVSSTLCWR